MSIDLKLADGQKPGSINHSESGSKVTYMYREINRVDDEEIYENLEVIYSEDGEVNTSLNISGDKFNLEIIGSGAQSELYAGRLVSLIVLIVVQVA